MSAEENKKYQCPECQAGVMHLDHITYFTWLNEELVTVPNFPAWVCDVCGRREYDARAMAWLAAILSPETGKAPGPRRTVPIAPRPRGGTRPFKD